jgi:hypothetical protein
MVRVSEFFNMLNAGGVFAGKKWPGGYHIVMNVHDELVFDFPALVEKNLPIVREVQRLMEMGGEHIGVKTPVDVEFHPVSWDKGVRV